ncbi:helix-turn-helix transcriptional regulator [Paenibacillus sp. CAU 1782]
MLHKVMLVDLSPHSIANQTHWLDWRRLGYTLGGVAKSLGDAVSLFARERFSLVVIHIRDAHAEGIRLCERIREICRRIPLVLIGGRMDFHSAREAMHYGVSDYLPAPFTLEEVTDSLRSLREMMGEEITTAGASSHGDSLYQTRPGDETGGEAAEHAPDARLRDAHVIDKVKAYVEDSLDQAITLKEISTNMHFNCSYLGQKFKYHENMTFNEYLLQQRMEKAKFLLEHTGLKIYEIANKVGYIEIDWFYKKFKSYTGVSANAYRKMRSITA